jgi:murein DD-endopeptidase MepM/ murein hydrolase activator NlpD
MRNACPEQPKSAWSALNNLKTGMILMVLCGILFLFSACSFEQAPAPVTNYGGSSGPGSAGMHTVAENDTVFSLSQRYEVNMPALIKANNLRAPFRLDIGQRLKIPPPSEYRVRPGDTLYGVSRLFNVSQTRLARRNNLSPPYILQPGQSLRLPASGAGARREIIASAPDRRIVRPAQKPEQLSNRKTASGKTAAYTRQFSKPSKFIKPVSGKIISGYGPKENGLHNDGVNIAASRGAPVRAAADGEVVYAGNALKGYGNLILVKHGGGYLTAYGHLGRMLVKKGEVLEQGQSLGTVGTSGQVTRPQIHFEIRKGSEAINPAQYL